MPPFDVTTKFRETAATEAAEAAAEAAEAAAESAEATVTVFARRRRLLKSQGGPRIREPPWDLRDRGGYTTGSGPRMAARKRGLE